MSTGRWVRVITDNTIAGAPEMRLYVVRNGNSVEAEGLVRAFIGDLAHSELKFVREAQHGTVDRFGLAPNEVWFG